MKTKEEFEAALLSLGNTAEAVHDTLLAEGCKGQRLSAVECPVAKFMAKQAKNNTYVTSISTLLFNTYLGTREEPFSVSIFHPSAVKDFIVAFDKGGYPDLILENKDDSNDTGSSAKSP